MLSGKSRNGVLRYLLLSGCWCVYLGTPNGKDSLEWGLGTGATFPPGAGSPVSLASPAILWTQVSVLMECSSQAICSPLLAAGSGSTTCACSSCSCWCSKSSRRAEPRSSSSTGARLRPRSVVARLRFSAPSFSFSSFRISRFSRSRSNSSCCCTPGAARSAPARPSCSSSDQLRGSLCRGRDTHSRSEARGQVALPGHSPLDPPPPYPTLL